MHSRVRIIRPALALAAILAFAAGAGAAAASSVSPGASGSPSLELGGNVALVTTVIHNSRHQVVTSVTIGTVIHPAVTVSGVSGTPTGSVNITLWTNGTCSGTGLNVVGVALTNGMADPDWADYPATTVGALSYKTRYLGDAVYPAAYSSCASVTVTKLDPAVSLVMHDDNHAPTTDAYIGMALHAFVQVGGRGSTPTGTVKIYRWNGSACIGTASIVGPYSLSGGSVDTSYQWLMDTAGTFAYRATYQGDAKYNAYSSSCVVVHVSKWPVAFATEMHSRFETVITHAYVGDTVHAAATLSGGPGTPTGTVQVRIYNGADCTGAPTQSVAVAAASVIDPAGPKIVGFEPGNISWQLEYLGNASYLSATGPCMTMNFKSGPNVDIAIHDANDKPITTLTAGQAAHVRVDVSGGFGTPTGQVTIKWFATGTCSGPATPLGTRTLSNGVVDDATLRLVPAKAGMYSFSATYLGDTAYAGDQSNCAVLTVVAAPVVTPKPTAVPAGSTDKPTSAPTSTPSATEAVAGMTSPPDPTAGASAAPTATAQPAPSAAPAATGANAPGAASPGAGSAGGGSAGAGSGAGAAGPTAPSSDAGLPWIALLFLLLILIAGFVIWARTRTAGQRRRSAEAAH